MSVAISRNAVKIVVYERILVERKVKHIQHGAAHDCNVKKIVFVIFTTLSIILSCLRYNKNSALDFSLRAERWNNYGLVTPLSVQSIFFTFLLNVLINMHFIFSS